MREFMVDEFVLKLIFLLRLESFGWRDEAKRG
jgi:hypothetical protein